MDYINTFLANTPHFLAVGGYWFLGIIVILEGIPIIGSLLPGHVIIIMAGFLAKMGILSLPHVIVVVAVAAVLGDIIGFLLGRKYGYDFLKRFGKFIFIKDEHINKAKILIDNHTGKALVFGKFSPFTRPLTPFIVGASGVHIHTFWFWNIVGAILWSVISVGVGYIFGASYHIAAEFFGKFIFGAIISSILIIWAYRFVNVRFHIFRKYELFVLALNLVSLWALAKTIQDSLSLNSFMANFDITVNIFMFNYVTPIMVSIFTLITNIGGTIVTIGLGILIGLIYLYKRKWRSAAIMLLTIISTSIIVTYLKNVFMRARPDDALNILNDPSFPSGHASLAAAFFIILAYILAPKIKSWMIRELFITSCVVAVILIGVSRVVLNVHWASDVIAGWSLGVFLATGSVLLIRYAGVFFIKQDK